MRCVTAPASFSRASMSPDTRGASQWEAAHVGAIVTPPQFGLPLTISLHGLPRETFDAIARGVYEQEPRTNHTNGHVTRTWVGTVAKTKKLCVDVFTNEPPVEEANRG